MVVAVLDVVVGRDPLVDVDVLEDVVTVTIVVGGDVVVVDGWVVVVVEEVVVVEWLVVVVEDVLVVVVDVGGRPQGGRVESIMTTAGGVTVPVTTGTWVR